MNTNLISFKRGSNLSKVTLMLNDSIYKLLKDYSKDHRITMSCLVENLIVANLSTMDGENNGITNL
ncbi:hypothetical protein PM10SUCC1_19190 [Propionigenium maris DSM 9537]|uniref:Uncharacterized protein n=1 Tax=Propionigenium maris DSM 9537 TaxID=1123000 RepID=A0A9W6LNY2_9FUSO|nr:hypothetical protein PM10SUCC1_19190 [Propionigenium maris DSM 9537]